MAKKFVFKCLVAGQGGVGKTTLLTRAVTGNFVANTSMTIGVDFHLLNLDIDGGKVTLQLWDFGGQDRFRFMLESYVAGAKGAMLLYDLTRMRTLDNLDEWITICRKQDPNIPILFVGTKLDRVEDIVVADDYAREFMAPLNLFDHVKISSKDGTGVRDAFEKLARKIIELNGINLHE
jgi:small GTP-binding protein